MSCRSWWRILPAGFEGKLRLQMPILSRVRPGRDAIPHSGQDRDRDADGRASFGVRGLRRSPQMAWKADRMCDDDMREFLALSMNLPADAARQLVERLQGPALRGLRRQCVREASISRAGAMGCRRRRRARGPRAEGKRCGR